MGGLRVRSPGLTKDVGHIEIVRNTGIGYDIDLILHTGADRLTTFTLKDKREAECIAEYLRKHINPDIDIRFPKKNPTKK